MDFNALFFMLEKLRETNSAEKKIKILQDFRSDLVEKVLRLVYTPHQTWGITSKALHTRVVGTLTLSEESWWNAAQKIFENLASRYLSGNMAKSEVRGLYYSAPTDQHANLLKRILDRDLRIGIDAKTLNKAYPNFIEVFACQLAKEYLPKFVTYPVYVEPKIDGIRALAIEGKLYSRTGARIPNIAIEQHLPQHEVLDGELFAGDWAKTISARSDASIPMEYHIFDVIPLEEWTSEKFKMPLRERQISLGYYVIGPITKVPSAFLTNQTELQEAYSLHLDNGHEGVMIKDPKAPYSLRRSRAWMKLKPTNTLLAEVIDLQEGTGRNEGALGALVCKTGAGVEFKVGTGFSEEQRNAWWSRVRDNTNLIGQKIIVKYQALTPSHVPLFPRFISWCKHDQS